MLISIKDKNIEGVEIKDSINSMFAWSLGLVNTFSSNKAKNTLLDWLRELFMAFCCSSTSTSKDWDA